MNHINNHQSSRPTPSPLFYLQTKQLEKKMETALEQLTHQYQSSLTKAQRWTEQILEQVKLKEERVLEELDAVKDGIIRVVDEKWTKFKAGSRLLKKIYLGEESYRLLPECNIEQIDHLVTEITQQICSFDQIASEFGQKCKEFQNYFNDLEPKKQEEPLIKKQIVKNTFSGISPIKSKQMHSYSHGESELNIKPFGTVNELVQAMQEGSPNSRKFKTEMESNEKNQHNFQRAFGMMREQLKKQTSAKGIQQNTNRDTELYKPSSITKTKRAAPALANFEQIKSVESPKYQSGTGRLKKYSNAKLSLYEENEVRVVSPRTNTKRSRDLLDFSSKPERSKEESAGGGSYGSCLQRLQKQQFQYQRIRRGLS